MAEIDVDRVGGLLRLNGHVVARADESAPASVLATFYDLAESAEPPDMDGLREELADAEDEIGRLEGIIEAAKDVLSDR